MAWFRYIAMLVLCVSIAVAGIPAQAKLQCPMAAKMQMMGKECKGCTMTGKQEPGKKGCCDDSACAQKCSSVGSVTGTVLPASVAMPKLADSGQKFIMPDGVLPPHLLNTQDRPPKHLS